MKIFLYLALCISATAFGHSYVKKIVIHPNLIKTQPIVETAESINTTIGKVKGRIINGILVTSLTMQFPYQVKLYLKSRTESTDKQDVFTTCGGAIISHSWVLTAAHCIDTALEGYVYVGCTNCLDETGSCEKIPVTEYDYYWHDDFESSDVNTQNDIGLVRLPIDLTFSAHVNKIELNTNEKLPLNRQTVVVSGYGVTETGQLSDRLKYTTVKIINERICKKSFSNVNPTMICFGANSQTSDCQGDSGGPMTMFKNGKVLLVGITSYGGPTCLKYPGVYTRVSSFLDWICITSFVCYDELLDFDF